MPTRIILNGAKGRMGQALQACAAQDPEVEIAAAVDLGDRLEDVLDQGDVVVDFSLHGATLEVVTTAANRGKPVVIGTTGHTDSVHDAIVGQARSIPIVWASNFSTGVNTLFWLVRKAAEILGAGFDLEIIEMHHRQKRDAPSGTAKHLAEILASARGQHLAKVGRHGRQGITGERGPTEIGLHSVRGGDVVGDHTVIFAAPGERLELIHRASSRETFARGALRAARWILDRSPGFYDMQDVLGLK